MALFYFFKPSKYFSAAIEISLKREIIILDAQ